MAPNKGKQVIGSDINMSQLAAKVMLDAKDRGANTLAMFRPTEQQEPFFRKMAEDGVLEVLVGGGNRCLAGCQEIYDPVAKVSKRVDEIAGGFHVYSVNPETGETEIKRACQPFVKSFGELLKVTLSNGEVVHVTPEHRVVSREGLWVSVSQAWRDSVELASVCGSYGQTGRSKEYSKACQSPQPSVALSFSASSQKEFHAKEELSASLCGRHQFAGTLFRDISRMLSHASDPFRSCLQFQKTSLSLASLGSHYLVASSGSSQPLLLCESSLPTCGYSLSQHGDQPQLLSRYPSQTSHSHRGQCISLGLGSLLHVHRSGALRLTHRASNFLLSCLTYLRQCGGRLLSGLKSFRCLTPSRVCALERSPSRQQKDDPSPESSDSHQVAGNHFDSSSHPSFFSLKRNCESTRITNVESIGCGFIWDISVDDYSNYQFGDTESTGGIVNANSGKSTSCFIALASFLLNQPITLNDGTELHMRLPRQRKEAVKVWCIGYDWTHCANTMYRLLFKRDLFRIVRDPVTRQWRSWNPSLPGEVPFEKTTPSPPLLKMADIEPNTMSYENKRENQIKSFSMEHDGSKVEFYASTGNRPQGSPIDLCLIDEKLYDEEFYDELLMRLIDKRGRLIWSTYPGTCPSAKLQQVSERALAQEGNPSATAFYFRLKGSDNPFTKSKIRDAVINTLDEDQKLARDEGIIGMERWLVYPRFSKYIHRLWSSNPEEDDELAKACRKCNGIPPDWTRYLILDPGTQNAAVLFVAVPPPKFGDYIVPYDELYLHNVPAKGLAEAVRAKTKGQWFEDFIIDAHAARQTPMGFDGRIGDNYSKEFAACKLRCRRHGSGFSYGSDNVEGRILGLQGAMNVRGDGTVRLRIMTDSCKNLVQQLEQYKWGADPKGNPTEKPAKYQKIDVAVALEYLVSRDDCCYIRPPKQTEGAATLTSISAHIASMFSPRKKQDDSIYCGPGAPVR